MIFKFSSPLYKLHSCYVLQFSIVSDLFSCLSFFFLCIEKYINATRICRDMDAMEHLYTRTLSFSISTATMIVPRRIKLFTKRANSRWFVANKIIHYFCLKSHHVRFQWFRVLWNLWSLYALRCLRVSFLNREINGRLLFTW